MQTLIFIMLIILIVLVLLFNQHEPLKEVFQHTFEPKIIWILWFQGWDNPPWMIQKVKESWIKHNPNYSIRLLSDENLHLYLPNLFSNFDNKQITLQAKSDIIRLSLLHEYGGIWADATMLCMQSVDNWIDEMTLPSGIWMYTGYHGKGPASWFIVSQKNSYIIDQWKKACDVFWNTNDNTDTYFWMDSLFFNLMKTNSKFDTLWGKVPRILCDDINQAHTFFIDQINAMDYNEDFIQNIKMSPPFTIKLSRRFDNIENFKRTNIYKVIEISLGTFE